MITAEDVAGWSTTEVRRVLGLLMQRVQTRHRRGKWIDKLMALNVGDSFLAPEHASSANLCTAKLAARDRLSAPAAQWTTRMTNQGLRVTRIR